MKAAPTSKKTTTAERFTPVSERTRRAIRMPRLNYRMAAALAGYFGTVATGNGLAAAMHG